MKIISLITARGGSKGLPRKNVLELKGKPLITWTIEAALKCKHSNGVFVTTDDPEISRVSIAAGAGIINRPARLATDSSTSNEAIEHAIKELEQSGVDFDTVCLLQPTSPLRTAEHIDEACSIFFAKKANCVISVFEPSHSPAKAYKLEGNGYLTGLLFPEAPNTRRQELPICYQPNGAIYLFTKQSFTQGQCIPKENVLPYVMPEFLSGDIDVQSDLIEAEQLMEKLNYETSI